MTAHQFGRQLLRFGVVGIVSNAAGYMVYLIVTYLGATPKITASVLYGVGVAIGFWGNRRWTFQHKGSAPGTVARYLGVQCVGYLINIAMLVWLADGLGYPHQLVQAAAIVVVAVFLFVACRFFVFTERDFQVPSRR